MIPFERHGIHVLFHREELLEIQRLLSGEPDPAQMVNPGYCADRLPCYSLN
jgi:hypothetical protein